MLEDRFLSKQRQSNSESPFLGSAIISPNPVRNGADISFNLEQDEKILEVQIYDITGRPVGFSMNNLTQTAKLDTYQNGVLVALIKTNKNTYSNSLLMMLFKGEPASARLVFLSK